MKTAYKSIITIALVGLLVSLAPVLIVEAQEAIYTYTTIYVSGDPLSGAMGINDTGQIVGGYSDASRLHGFLLELEGGSFSTIDVPRSNGTAASGISDTGHIVGWYLDRRGDHGFLLKGGSFSTIDVPATTDTSVDPVGTYANGINNASQIVGTYYDHSSKNHGFLLDGGRFTTIDVPGANSIGYWTSASDINDAGQIVGSFFVPPISPDEPPYGMWYGFLFEGGSFTTISVPGARWTPTFMGLTMPARS